MLGQKIKIIILLLFSCCFFITSDSLAVDNKRCVAAGVKVVCPTQTLNALRKANAAYYKEAMDMIEGKSGSTYGIEPFDYLTGVGKRSPDNEKNKALAKGRDNKFSGESGYKDGSITKTELWSRVKKPVQGEGLYNQWINNWSPTFKRTLVPGADPNEGKQWYYVYCIACHGWTLQGDGPNAMELDPRPRILTKGSYMNKKTNLELFMVIKGGGEAVSLSSVMPAWGNYLQDQDIWNLIAFIRAMADVRAPKNLDEYLYPKSSFDPESSANAITPLNTDDSDEFLDEQELLEGELAGRGVIEGGKFIEGGLRKTPSEIDEKVKQGY
jgi:mono/diheme cytochrome c family protein